VGERERSRYEGWNLAGSASRRSRPPQGHRSGPTKQMLFRSIQTLPAEQPLDETSAGKWPRLEEWSSIRSPPNIWGSRERRRRTRGCGGVCADQREERRAAAGGDAKPQVLTARKLDVQRAPICPRILTCSETVGWAVVLTHAANGNRGGGAGRERRNAARIDECRGFATERQRRRRAAIDERERRSRALTRRRGLDAAPGLRSRAWSSHARDIPACRRQVIVMVQPPE